MQFNGERKWKAIIEWGIVTRTTLPTTPGKAMLNAL
jgi:hypothetical protein